VVNTNEDLKKGYEKLLVEYNAGMALFTTKLNYVLDLRKRAGKEIPCSVSMRLKTPDSADEKWYRKNPGSKSEPTLEDIINCESDIAGVRITFLFRRHINEVAEAIKHIPGVKIMKTKDYINNPKPNGYRSLHLIVNVEIYSETEGSQYVPVEIQLRTKAMDLWAELEHYLYKSKGEFPDGFKTIFKQVANTLQRFDNFGDQIYELITTTKNPAD
jgi:putative GTP pyrophosphokinase